MPRHDSHFRFDDHRDDDQPHNPHNPHGPRDPHRPACAGRAAEARVSVRVSVRAMHAANTAARLAADVALLRALVLKVADASPGYAMRPADERAFFTEVKGVLVEAAAAVGVFCGHPDRTDATMYGACKRLAFLCEDIARGRVLLSATDTALLARLAGAMMRAIDEACGFVALRAEAGAA